ncbi:hypothetical protein [Dactylosporangium aurantiacum]|nr:hypothetical protein [Dactylosporangium aurantiacum]MDG6105577.1 hypothetical protein [Dactylosporangium aurantiacum]
MTAPAPIPPARQVVLRWPDLPDTARAAWEQAEERPPRRQPAP